MPKNPFFSDCGLLNLPSHYESWDKDAKRNYLWEHCILPTKYKTLPDLNSFGLCKGLKSMLALLTLHQSFEHVSDEAPDTFFLKRVKAIHTLGAVAQVDLIAEKDHPYTGLFKRGTALARLSLAAPPALIGFTPGMAIKFFISGQPSQNIHLMDNLEGQGNNKNFFACPFNNNLPKPNKLFFKLFECWFSVFKKNPRYLPLDHLAKQDEFGNDVQNPKAPFELICSPNPALMLKTHHDFREELAEIKPGTLLYWLWARKTERALPVQFGKLVTTSAFVASSYADDVLFFRHHQ